MPSAACCPPVRARTRGCRSQRTEWSRDGDLVAFDTDLVGPFGYLTDVSHTYLCGIREPTAEQRDAYRSAYEFVQTSIPEFTEGRTFQELGGLLGSRFPERHRSLKYPFIAHGCGAADEYPASSSRIITSVPSWRSWSSASRPSWVW